MDPVRRLVDRLVDAYDQVDDSWWPVDRAYHHAHGTDARFEVVLGAILTQNTTWRNVETALERLKQTRLMSPQALLAAPAARVRACLEPAGAYRQKTAYVRGLSRRLVDDFDGRLDALFQGPSHTVRRRLLGVRGVGPETADAILVFAADRPRFVVDAYARRVACRVGLLQGGEPYDTVQARFEAALPDDAAALGRAHAALVEHAKSRCTKRAPRCGGCPVADACDQVGVAVAQA